MKFLVKKSISLVLCLVFLLCMCINVFAQESVTVSSECDISDINIPIDATVTDAQIGQTLDIKAKSCMNQMPTRYCHLHQ